MMYRSSVAMLATTALVLAAACDSDNTTSPTPQTARVRVVNLDQSSPNAGLYANGSLVGSNVAFGAAGASCLDVPVGQSLSFRSTGSTTDIGVNATPGLIAGKDYTIALYHSGTNAQVVILSDTGITAPATGTNGLRFFNATPTAGDIYVTAPGGAISGTPFNLSAGNASSGAFRFTTYPTASTQIRMFNVGTTTGTPRVNTAFTSANLSNSRVGTAFLTESNMTGTSTNASVVVAPCS
jgi:hypothetical protein